MATDNKPRKSTLIDFSNPALFVPVYRRLLYDTNRTKIIYGGRGSAKSFFVAQHKVIRCLKMRKFKCLMVRKMRADVKKSVYATVEGVIKFFGLQDFFEFNKGYSEITCKLNGNRFLPLGLNEVGGKSGNAKSVFNPSDAILEEADEITEEEFDKLSLSLRGNKSLEEVLIFNPPNPDHWIVKRFFPPDRSSFERADGMHTYIKSTVPNTTILHTNYLMNPHCQKSEVDLHSQLKKTNFKKYEVSSLGLLKRKKTDGAALEAFDREKHVVDFDLFDRSRRVVICQDFNRWPFHTVGLWQFHKSEKEPVFYMDLVREFCLEGKSVKQVQQAINKYLYKRNYEPKKIRYIGDFSGKSLKDHDTDSLTAKVHQEIRKGGFQVIDETNPNPAIVASLDFLNDIFSGEVFLSESAGYTEDIQIKIRISNQAAFHIEDYEETKTGPDGKLLKVMVSDWYMDDGVKVKRSYQKRGHAIDATRYSAVGIFETEFSEYKQKNK